MWKWKCPQAPINMCLHSRGPSAARANYGQLQLPSASLQSRARCRLLPTLPSPLSRAHATPSPLPRKVNNVIQFSELAWVHSVN